ncbi:MAG: sel1 repeat family protein [Barnesiella sp.]|nr:sel1 repeat family protein [Barnesiella sp.]
MTRHILLALSLTIALFASATIPQSKIDAAESGNADAQCELGLLYYQAEDYDNAFQWFSKAAKAANASAMYNLAICYENGHGTAKDILEAVILYRHAAEKDLPEAQYMLAGCYADGVGTQRNSDLAKKWYQRASDQGYPLAQYQYAIQYLEKNDPDYAKLLKNAYSKDIKKAAYPLAVYFIEGPEPDDIYAIALLKKGVDAGDDKAMYYLATLYRDGKIVAKDSAMAFELFQKAADKGNTDSSLALADCYERGIGTSTNESNAIEVYRSIANISSIASEKVKKYDEDKFTSYRNRILRGLISRLKYVSFHHRKNYTIYLGAHGNNNKIKRSSYGSYYILSSPISEQEYYAIVENREFGSTNPTYLKADEAKRFLNALNQFLPEKLYYIASEPEIIDAYDSGIIGLLRYRKCWCSGMDIIYHTGSQFRKETGSRNDSAFLYLCLSNYH